MWLPMWICRTVPEDGSADVLAEPKDKDDVIVTVNWYRVALQFSYASGQYHHIAHGNIYDTVKKKEEDVVIIICVCINKAWSIC